MIIPKADMVSKPCSMCGNGTVYKFRLIDSFDFDTSCANVTQEIKYCDHCGDMEPERENIISLVSFHSRFRKLDKESIFYEY
jgi:hypothetical protein